MLNGILLTASDNWSTHPVKVIAYKSEELAKQQFQIIANELDIAAETSTDDWYTYPELIEVELHD